MADTGLTLFDTAIGRVGIAWSPRGLRAVALPAETDASTLARLRRRCPGAVDSKPPEEVRKAVVGIVAHLEGRLDDLKWIALDHEGAPDLHREIWRRIRDIPPGETRTYGEIAADLGDRALAQTVGQAMGRNPTPIIAPCHRVLAAGGRTGGFSAPGGVATKFRILQIEQAKAGWVDQPGLFGNLPLSART